MATIVKIVAIAGAGDNDIVAVACEHDVIAIAGRKGIVAGAAIDDVVVRRTDDAVVAWRSADGVRAARSSERRTITGRKRLRRRVPDVREQIAKAHHFAIKIHEGEMNPVAELFDIRKIDRHFFSGQLFVLNEYPWGEIGGIVEGRNLSDLQVAQENRVVSPDDTKCRRTDLAVILKIIAKLIVPDQFHITR